jgi:sec-independent protein translocase protein TatC
MSDVLDPGAGAVDRLTGGPPVPPPEAADEKVMSLVDHLSELRKRVAISILGVLIGGVVGFWLAPQIITLLAEPLPDAPPGQTKLQFLTVSGGFLLYMRISIIVGILLGLPVILYQAWAFVAPGLTPRERRTTLPWIPMTVVFFLLGAAVAYVTMPYAIGFLTGFTVPGILESQPSAEAYFGFVSMTFLIFGLVMQFPIVLVVLSRLGILSVERLKQMRRYVLLGVVVFAVVVTPGGDPISPIVMSATMYALYELTIFLLSRSARGGDVAA